MKQPHNFTKTGILKAMGIFIAFLSIVFLLAPFTTLYPITFGPVELFGFSFYYAFLPLMVIVGFALAFRGKLGDFLGKKFYFGSLIAIIGIGFIFGFVGKNALGDADLIENYASLFGGDKAFVADLKASSGLLYHSFAVLISENLSDALFMTIAIILIVGGLILAFLKPILKVGSKISLAVGNKKAKRQSEKEIERRTEEYIKNYENEANASYESPFASEPKRETNSYEAPLPSRFVANHEHPRSEIEIPKEPSFMPQQQIDIPTRQIERSGLRNAVFTFGDEPISEPTKPTPIEENPIINPFASFTEEPKQAFAEPEPIPEPIQEPIPEPKVEETPIFEEPAKEEPMFLDEAYVSPAPIVEEAPEEMPYEEDNSIDDLLDEEAEEPMFLESNNIILEEKAPAPVPEPVVVAPAPAPAPTPAPAPQPVVPELSPEEKALKELHQEMAKPLPPYVFPSLDLLQVYDNDQNDELIKENCDSNVERINKVLTNLNVGAKVISYTVGPSVTRYNIQTNDDVSVSAISKVIKDICVRLGGQAVRFEEIVRGQDTSGLEIPNSKSRIISLKEMMSGMSPDPKDNMLIPFGVSISGECVCSDLSKFPHMMVAGTTGSGKSIFMHGLIMSLIMRNRPEDCQIVLIDPKRVEMTKYKDLPHLLCPIIKEPSEAKVCMDKLIEEMDRRYRLFEFAGCRDIRSFNTGYAERKGVKKLPFIVVFIDEYADLVDTCKNIGEPVVRIAQKARAAGIHLVIATQRPSVQVITGVIKANIPVRVALSMSSATDSITIINQGGAEDLVGHGDMLIDCSLIARVGFTRAQGCLVLDEEIERVVDFIKGQGLGTMYNDNFLDLVDHEEEARIAEANAPQVDAAAVKAQSNADFYETVKETIMTQEYTSISKIQRMFSIGFPRAGKIFQQLQADGIVAMQPDSPSSAKGCKVLIHMEENSDLDGIKLASDN